ncbi:hypothetical protein [Streptomyces sp. NBC_01006]|uniref:hypothetical protein n=1 Tax=Streptomyces sp. NBC_01006 TaxID=2903716 RepID=UPI00386D81CD|nr:hypothetical protein OG509_31445 [Streptomyces sp. NBC_01006]
MGGDDWAGNVLVRRLPGGLWRRIVRVTGPTPTGTGRALLEPQLNSLFHGRMAAHDREIADMFIGRRALHGAASEGLADEALVRALVGTGAELVVVPQDDLPLREGVGALFRYTDAGTPS